MAKKFIDAEEILKRLQDLCSDDNIWGDENFTLVDFAQVEETILDMPAADVQEVKHGRWKKIQYYARCSECRHAVNWASEDFLSPFCANCGARMDGK